MQDYLQLLNDSQKEAVKNTNGPSLVIAAAGSGKTRVLTYRIAHLLKQGIPAFSILALTFTNKAAKEMKSRITQVVGESAARYLWMGTFHSIFARILRNESEALGFPSNFTIYDTSDSRNVIKAAIKELKLDDKTYKPAEILARISWAKNNLVTARAYSSNEQIIAEDRANRKNRIGDLYKAYTLRCFRAGAMDFDDLLLNTNILFRDNPDILAKYQDIFRYILVDEYQDTNYSQYLIIKRLAEKHQNVTVVGDDAQSIYSFRGAKIENILNFRKDYPTYKLFKLEQNYRSTQMIVDAANSVIAHNTKQIKKNAYSTNEIGSKIKVLATTTDSEEGIVVSNTIIDTEHRDHLKHNDFAILYRTNAQSRIFEEALRKKNIPYRVYGSISFYQRKEIKDLLAYFRLIINPKDDEALNRVINYPKRGIGNTTMTKIQHLANLNNTSQWEVLCKLENIDAGLNSTTKNKIKSFIEFINSFIEILYQADAFDLASEIAYKSGIYKELKSENTPENISKLENLEELLNAIKEYTEEKTEDEIKIKYLPGFMENVALLTDQDNDKSQELERVTLMTVHASKGLEFKVVFLSGLEEELFPSRMSISCQKDLEEERRLFYVALTRAEKLAYISYAQTRYKWGSPTFARPSRFISEISPEYLDMPDNDDLYNSGYSNFNLKQKKSYSFEGSKEIRKASLPSHSPNRRLTKLSGIKTDTNQGSSSLSFKSVSPDKIVPGTIVEHPRFGSGKVLQVEGNMPNTKAIIFFQEAGQKQLLLKFAKLKIKK